MRHITELLVFMPVALIKKNRGFMSDTFGCTITHLICKCLVKIGVYVITICHGDSAIECDGIMNWLYLLN